MTRFPAFAKYLSLVVLMATASLSPAQKFKVATVDFNYLLANYYVFKEALQEKQVETETIQEEDFGRKKRIDALRQELERMAAEVNDPSLSESRREAVAQALQSKDADLKALMRERDVFLETSRNNLEQKMMSLQSDINRTIAETVQEYAASQDVDFVFDETGVSLSRVPFLIYVRDKIDFTEPVLKILNADAPAPEDEDKSE